MDFYGYFTDMDSVVEFAHQEFMAVLGEPEATLQEVRYAGAMYALANVAYELQEKYILAMAAIEKYSEQVKHLEDRYAELLYIAKSRT